MNKLIIHLKPAYIITLVLLFVVVGCSSKQVPSATHQSQKVSHSDIEEQLRSEYLRWENVPHKYGGNDRRGVDCSGFVRTLYDDLFQIKIPRTTKTQINVGTPVSRKDLRAGDIVFFKLQPPSYPRHVGIYLGNGEFIHASKSKGVITSKLNSGYWSKYYQTARRHPIKQEKMMVQMTF